MRALGMLLYHAGLSYEKAGMFAGASYEAVREWYQKGKELFEESIEKKRRKWIAVDEKEIKINGAGCLKTKLDSTIVIKSSTIR
jgi:transposase-like protein